MCKNIVRQYRDPCISCSPLSHRLQCFVFAVRQYRDPCTSISPLSSSLLGYATKRKLYCVFDGTIAIVSVFTMIVAAQLQPSASQSQQPSASQQPASSQPAALGVSRVCRGCVADAAFLHLWGSSSSSSSATGSSPAQPPDVKSNNYS